MITNFEEFTYELSDEELTCVNPLVDIIKRHTKNNPIKSDLLLINMLPHAPAKWSKKSGGVRLRKIINHIRTNAIIPIIATSSGYYVSYEEKEIRKFQTSMYQRAEAIIRCANGLNAFLPDDESVPEIPIPEL